MSYRPDFSKEGLPTTLKAQILQDPQLPRPMTNIPQWQIPAHPIVSSIQSKTLPKTADYVVIGSGVTATGTVKTLLEHPWSKQGTITVLEARTLCSGATGRNGGQLVRPYPPRFALHCENFGIDMAKKIARVGMRTLEKMHQLAASEPGLAEEASVRRLHKFLVYMDQSSWDKAQELVAFYELNLPEQRGAFQRVSAEEAASKYNVKGAYGGFKIPAGACSPYRLITGVMSRLLERYPDRLTIETNTPVVAIEHNEAADAQYPYLVVTPRGYIRAANVIHCTNGHAGHLLPKMRGKIHPWRGTMSTQERPERFPKLGNEQSWTFLSDPTYNAKQGLTKLGWFYMQQNPQTGDIWIGGENKRIEECFTSDDNQIGSEGKKNLSGILTNIFNDKVVPAQPEIKGIWTGVMAYTGDALPFVGRLPESATGRKGTGEWIAAGYNSIGMANALSCGEAVAKMILKEDVSDWFPEAYRVSEERLNSPLMKTDKILERFYTLSGIDRAFEQDKVEAKL